MQQACQQDIATEYKTMYSDHREVSLAVASQDEASQVHLQPQL
jgi:hypothetical protein